MYVNKNRFQPRCEIVFALMLVAPALRAQEPSSSTRIALRVVVFTESDGSNAAASHKQIEQQVAVLRNDAARHGLEVNVKATTFVADSARRHADGAALARNADKDDPGFAPSKDEVVIYVTGLRLPVVGAAGPDKRLALTPTLSQGEREQGSSAGSSVQRGSSTPSLANPPLSPLGKGGGVSPCVLRRGADSALLPAIVIDASEFGGQGCGQGRDKPCRALSRAVGEVLSMQSAAALRAAGEAMTKAASRAEE